MKGLVKQATGALFLLIGIAAGARVMYALLVPLLPILLCAAALIIVYVVALRFWDRL